MKKSKSRIAFEIFNIILMVVLIVLTLYPILNQLAVSLSSNTGILTGEVKLLPIDFSLDTYKGLMKESKFWINYKNTIVYTVLGTVIGRFHDNDLCVCFIEKRLVGRVVILRLIVFTMIFWWWTDPDV